MEDSSLRILFVTPSFDPYVGGAQTFQRAMARRLIDDGHSVRVLTSDARSASDFWRRPKVSRDVEAILHEEIDGIQVERLLLTYPWPSPYACAALNRARQLAAAPWLPRKPSLWGLARLAAYAPPLRELERHLECWVSQANLVQATDSSWDGMFTKAARVAERLDRPFVAIPLMHLGDKQVRTRFQAVHQVDAYRSSGAVVALSPREATAYSHLGVPRERIRAISMGIDPTVPRISSEDVAQFRHRHALSGPTVAFIGANTYDKGAFNLLLSIAALNRSGVTVDVALAGTEANRAHDFIRSFPTRDRAVLECHTRLLGVVDERTKHILLAASDLFALPSQVDAFGIVFLEAWLHGKPVIGAACGGIPDLVRPERDGLLVPFGDSAALAAAIRRLIGDPGLARRLGEEGRNRVASEFTWDHTYRALISAYDVAIESRRTA